MQRSSGFSKSFVRENQCDFFFVVRLVIIFKVKTLLHNKHFSMPESSTLPCYIREFTG